MNRIEHVTASYRTLLALLGQPNAYGDPDKVQAEWQLETPNGWAEVYDYKEDRWAADDLVEWHVQGANDAAIDWVVERIHGVRSAIDRQTSFEVSEVRPRSS